MVVSARANLWSIDAYVEANEQTTSITPASSLVLTCTYSGECCAVYDGPGVSQGLWMKQVEEKMEEIYLALDSSPSRPQEQDHLSSGSPLPQDPVPPPGPAVGGKKRSESP